MIDIANHPLISVIIPFKNEEKTIAYILDSLNKQEVDFPFEVLLADGCSVDNSVEIINKHPLHKKAEVKVLPLPPDNHGMTVARNMAVEKAHGKFIIFSQSDIKIDDPNALKKIADALENDDTVGTYCIMKSVPKNELELYDFWGKVVMARYIEVVCQRDYSTKFNGVKAEVFRRMNGFDEKRYAWGGEDFDFVVRLSKEGLIAQPDVTGTHMHAYGRNQTAIGVIKKFCRNSEVMGACLPGYLKNSNFMPNTKMMLAKEILLCLLGLSCLIPATWPWSFVTIAIAGLAWQASSYRHIRDWRLIYLPFFGILIMFCYTFYFLRGLLMGKTSVQLAMRKNSTD